MEIKPIVIPRNVIRDLPPPVVQNTPPPVVSGIEVPIIEVPNPVIEYPVIDVPTQEQFEGMLAPQQPQEEEPKEDTRDLPPPAPAPAPAPAPTGPVVSVGGVDVTLPAPDVIATAGTTAVVATTASLVAGIVVKKVTGVLSETLTKRKKFKVKAKRVTPVLHYVLNPDKSVDILQYSSEGMKVIDSTDNVETYLRDQIETDALYEDINKVIIDEALKEQFTKEGQKRFKTLFLSPSKLAKKLAAKISI